MSIGAQSFKIKIGDDYITDLNEDTLEYTLGDESSAEAFSSSNIAIIPALREKYPDTLFIIVA